MDSEDSEEDEVVEDEEVEDAAGPQVQIFFVTGDKKKIHEDGGKFFFVLKNFKQNYNVRFFIFSFLIRIEFPNRIFHNNLVFK